MLSNLLVSLFWCWALATLSGMLALSHQPLWTYSFATFRVPLSTSFGRRAVYLASTLVCFGSAIWRAKATTYGSFMGACVLNGLGAGPGEVYTTILMLTLVCKVTL